MNVPPSGSITAALGAGLLLSVCALAQAQAAANCIDGEREPPYTIGWANIYSVPTWMKQTQGTIETEVERLKQDGLVDELVVTDAQGDANVQIQQIQSMIDSDVDAIILIAGSSTAPARVLADACAKGIAIVNFDSLVDTDDVTAKVNTDSAKWGAAAAQFMVDSLDGKGKVLVLNGPAGVSVSDDRRRGADPVLADNPGIEILAETNTDYNVAPAQEAVTSLLFANPEIDGILSFGGALSTGAVLALDRQGRDMVPVTGENARQFLELWKEKDLTAWATMQPNWLGAFATWVAVQALEGADVPAFVEVPLPVIDNDNLGDYLAKAADYPADGYVFSDYDQALFKSLLEQ